MRDAGEIADVLMADSPPPAKPNAERGALADASEYELAPLDWAALVRDGLPRVEFLEEPYFARGARIWLWGPTGTAKSMFSLWTAAKLTRAGIPVAYFSEENPLSEDVRRLEKLRPNWELLRFFHGTGIDLTDPRWVDAMLDATAGSAAVFFDTWTDCWRGDENVNQDVRDFDTNVLKALVARGAAPFVVHHTGHPSQFVKRTGPSAARGASTLGQKADTVLEFKLGPGDGFTIHHGKARLGGRREPDRSYRVVDVDGGLEIVEERGTDAGEAAEVGRNLALEIVRAEPGKHSKTALADRLNMRRGEGLAVVGELLRDGLIGPDEPRAKLRVLEAPREAPGSSVSAGRKVPGAMGSLGEIPGELITPRLPIPIGERSRGVIAENGHDPALAEIPEELLEAWAPPDLEPDDEPEPAG